MMLIDLGHRRPPPNWELNENMERRFCNYGESMNGKSIDETDEIKRSSVDAAVLYGRIAVKACGIAV